MKKYFLGADQGGTKTTVILCDNNGYILGTGHDSGLATVYFNDTDELFMKRIVNAAEQACNEAGISLKDVSAVCGGLNGADWDFEYPVLHERLSKALNISDAAVLNDCIAAMRGGSVERNCAVICAGTGLNIAVCREDGKQIIYGYYIDNTHQGAGALGSAALRKVMEASLGLCNETALTEPILKQTGYETAEQLMIDITMGRYDCDSKTFTPLLLNAYATGDLEAAGIIDEFAHGVANYIPAAVKRLDMCNKSFDIVFSGGVFKENGIILADKIFEIISLTEPNLRKVHAKYEPACGAALTLLDREYNHNIPAEIKKAFEKTATKHNLLRNPQTYEK